MRRTSWPAETGPWNRTARTNRSCRLLALGLAALLNLPGCGRQQEVAVARIAEPLTVQVTTPQLRNIVRVVGQPSFVESYERTSIYPKLSAYIEKWYVDIGDKVKKGQTLASLFVPETREDWETKKRTVKLDKSKVILAKKVVEVSEANVESAEAQ